MLFNWFFSALDERLGDLGNVLDRHAVHGEQALIGRGLAKLVLNADSLDDALAHLGGDLAHGGAETVEDVVVLDRDDLADLVDRGGHSLHVERLDGVHVDDADGDTLTVVETLNDETLRTINNAPRGEALNVTITGEKLYSLSLNSVNTITITVTDGKGGTAYRRLTFKRTNSAPAISGTDTDLGLKTGSFAENYTITDVEGDNVVVTEFVDDDEIRSYQATLGEEATIELTREKWLMLTNGTHQLRVEAVDGNFATSVRVWNFSKAENTIAFQFSAPEETDARATKILITPTWKIEGAVAKVEACNNAFDAVPTWEDITAMVQLNRVFNFTNETKTADKWGVNVRFTIVKNEGYEGEVSISGFGGAYE